MANLQYLLSEGKKMSPSQIQSQFECSVLQNSNINFANCFYSFGKVQAGFANIEVNHNKKELYDLNFFPFIISPGLQGNGIGLLAFGKLLVVARECCNISEGYNFNQSFSCMSDDFKKMLIRLKIARAGELFTPIGEKYSVPFIPMLKQECL